MLGLVLILVAVGLVVHLLLSRLISGAGDDAAPLAGPHLPVREDDARPAPDDDPAFLRSLRERPDSRGPEGPDPQA